jgi:hypothetical protein
MRWIYARFIFAIMMFIFINLFQQKSLTNMQGFKFVSNSSAKAVSIMLNSTLEKVDFNLYPLKNYRCNMTTETKRITHRVGHLF